jgi:hypothetical protein
MIGANLSAFHSVPIGMNLVMSFLAQSISPTNKSYIRTSSHPINVGGESLINAGQRSAYISQGLTFGLCFLPGAYIALIVHERVTKIKHLQMISGMSILAYWVGNLLFDVLNNIIVGVASVFTVFYAVEDVSFNEYMSDTVALVSMYGIAIVPATVKNIFCYLQIWNDM